MAVFLLFLYYLVANHIEDLSPCLTTVLLQWAAVISWRQILDTGGSGWSFSVITVDGKSRIGPNVRLLTVDEDDDPAEGKQRGSADVTQA